MEAEASTFYSVSPPTLLMGGEIAKTTAIALFALTIYEYAITLDDERRYFWKGPHTISHGLFFFNRYVPPCIVVIALVCFSTVNPTVEFCKPVIQAAFFLNILAVNVIQAILVTHTWFLFPGAYFVRITLVTSFVVSVTASLVFLGLSVSQLEVLAPHPSILRVGCLALRPPEFWLTYLPSFILHTGIQTLVMYNAFTNPDWKRLSLGKRLLKDGGAFYMVVIFAVGFASIGSILTNVPQINLPATFSPLILSLTSISTTRLMFALRETTFTVGSSFEWLPMPGPPSIFTVGARNGPSLVNLIRATSTHSTESISQYSVSDEARSMWQLKQNAKL